jgi:hypothetical protein
MHLDHPISRWWLTALSLSTVVNSSFMAFGPPGAPIAQYMNTSNAVTSRLRTAQRNRGFSRFLNTSVELLGNATTLDDPPPIPQIPITENSLDRE